MPSALTSQESYGCSWRWAFRQRTTERSEKNYLAFSSRGVVSFSYWGKPYSVCIDDVACHPQSYAAAASILQTLTTVLLALAVDIGCYSLCSMRLNQWFLNMQIFPCCL